MYTQTLPLLGVLDVFDNQVDNLLRAAKIQECGCDVPNDKVREQEYNQ